MSAPEHDVDVDLAAYDGTARIDDTFTPPEAWELRTGDHVGGYEIVASLPGDPVLGDLYQVRSSQAQSGPLALRVLRRELAADRAFRARFRREIQAQLHFSHPHVLPVLDGGEDAGRLYIVTPLLQAPTLERVLQAGPLAPDEALMLLAPVADALDAAHDAGLLHRGLTPACILVPRAGHAVLSGFGLVGLRQRPARALEYLPPEEIESSPSTEAGDRYAFAAILHECMTGVRPSVPASPAELEAHGHTSRPRPEPLAPALGAVLSEALAIEPWARPDRARTLIDACAQALADTEPSAGTGMLRGSGRLVIAATALVILAAAAGVLTGGGGSGSAGPAVKQGVASANGVEIALPATWSVHTGATKAIPGFPLASGTIASPADLRGVAALVIGRRSATGPLVGTTTFQHRLEGLTETAPQVVRIGNGQGYRVTDVRASSLGRRATLYVLPTRTGMTLVGCVALAGYAPAFLSTCERLVGGAQIANGAGMIPAGAADRHDAALAAALAQLKADRQPAFDLLTAARSRATQSSAAAQVATAYQTAARSVTSLPAASLTAQRDAGVKAALVDAWKWWSAASRAAARGDRAVYVRARAETAKAQQALNAATQTQQ